MALKPCKLTIIKKALLFTVLTFCSLISFSQWNNQDDMTIGDVYDFDIGDVFESSFSMAYQNYSTSGRSTIFDKKVYQDSIVYSIETQSIVRTIEIQPDGFALQVKQYSVDSIEYVYRNINTSVKVAFPDLCIDSILMHYNYDTNAVAFAYDSTFDIRDEFQLYLPSNLRIYGVSFYDQFENSNGSYYVEGLGSIYSYVSNVGESRIHKLSYYKKSYGSEGTPHFFPTGIDNPNGKPANLLVYPNPATAFINIRDVSFQKAYAYQIFNLSGQLVQQGILQSGEEQISIQNLNSGMYLLHTENRDQPVKIFIQ